jgi:hypothetical protein
MVDYALAAHMPEVKDMVRRDPDLREVFPELRKMDIATDEERRVHGIPTFARINVPLCLSIEELGTFADDLASLAHRMKGVVAERQSKELHRLGDIAAGVRRLNARYKDKIDDALVRRGERRSKMTPGEVRYSEEAGRLAAERVAQRLVENGDKPPAPPD